MNKIISVLLLGFCLVGSSLSAQTARKAIAGTSDEIKTNLLVNTVKFSIPKITQEELNHCAQYYTNVFDVKLAKNDEVIIQLKENNPKSNRIILRFLSALQINSIFVSEKEFTPNDFYEAFLI